MFTFFLSTISFSQNISSYVGKTFNAEVGVSCEMYEDGTGATIITYKTIKIIDKNNISISEIVEIEGEQYSNNKQIHKYKWSPSGKSVIIENINYKNLSYHQILSLEFRNQKVFAKVKYDEVKELEFKEIKD